MRISTSNLFDSNVSRINDTQSSLAKIQQQISTGKRLLTPADDPLAPLLPLGPPLVVHADSSSGAASSTEAASATTRLEAGIDVLQEWRWQRRLRSAFDSESCPSRCRAAAGARLRGARRVAI